MDDLIKFFIVGIGLIIFNYIIFQGKKITKGKFKVIGYKNNEIIFMKEYENQTFTVQPGSKYDKIEIID